MNADDLVILSFRLWLFSFFEVVEVRQLQFLFWNSENPKFKNIWHTPTFNNDAYNDVTMREDVTIQADYYVRNRAK